MQFTVTCSMGLEGLIQAELSGWGSRDIEIGNGFVRWSGDLESGYRACLWSRYASRVLLTIDEAPVSSSDELYEFSRLQKWEDHLGSDNSFAVDGTCAKGAALNHSHFAALRVKDGIADRFREKHGVRPDVSQKRPDVRLNVHVGLEIAVLSVDMSGESLHRRGYRIAGGEAPLRENLAAALVTLSGWDGEAPLLDPMCGSATILIEAALIAGNSAPGLGRTYYGFTNWRGHEQSVWREIVDDALEKEHEGGQKNWPIIKGYDADAESIGYARENIRRAGLVDRIEVSRQELLTLQADVPAGWLVCNPPYGERLAEQDSLKYLYRCLGNRLQFSFENWHIGLFTSQVDYADMLRIPWEQHYRLYNGPLACRLYTGVAGKRAAWSGWELEPKEAGGDKGIDFSNRLRKNFKQLQRWAHKNNVQSFRLYDRDLQEYNVSVDLFYKYVFVQEFPSSSRITPEVARQRFNAVLQGVRSVLGVGRDRVFTKKQLNRKSRPWPSPGTSKKLYEVLESGRVYMLDFSGSADVGIPLEQRSILEQISAEATGKRFLNLFGHTGIATIAAAHGGTADSVTIEAERHYLAWADKNFAANGMYPGKHQLLESDPLDWLRGQNKKFDLVFADLSQTASRSSSGFEQQKLTELITLVMLVLQPGGTFYYVSKGSTCRPGADLENICDCSNISAQMLPQDFARHPHTLHFWQIRHCKEPG